MPTRPWRRAALVQDLHDAPVLEQRDARLRRRHVDEELFPHALANRRKCTPEDQADREERRRDRRAAVGDERQRNSGRRREADHHRGVDDDREEDHARSGRATRKTPPRSRAVCASFSARRKSAAKSPSTRITPRNPHSSAMTARMKSVCWTGRNRSCALRAAAEPLARETAGADGDLRLAHLVARAEDVGVGVQERPDPLLLVVLQEEPRRRPPRRRRSRTIATQPFARQPAEEAGRRRGAAGTSARGRCRAAGRRAAPAAPTIAPSLTNVGHVDARVVLVLEEVRDEQRGRDLGELRRLELELTEPDPGADVGDPLAERRGDRRRGRRQAQ